MNPGKGSQDWQANWKAQQGGMPPMKSDLACTKAHALERKLKLQFWGVPALLALFAVKAGLYFTQFPEPWIRAGWAWAGVTLIYAAARWLQVGRPVALQSAAASEACAEFLRTELGRKRARILELQWILLLLFPSHFAIWWGGGPVTVAKRLGIEWNAFLQFQASPGPLIGFALFLAFIWFKLGQEADAIQEEMQALS
jgi:predicted nucleic acid-binding Zn ribbon protein